jgi:hypothetical protein
MWGWILTLLVPGTIAAFAVVSFVVRLTGGQPGNLAERIVNSLIFLIGAIGVFAFPAGIIVLIVGYTRRSKAQQN